MIRALVVVAGCVTAGGCGLVLGFEDHEPYPPDGGAGGVAPGAGGIGGAPGGMGGTGGSGGAGGSGGDPGVRVLLIPDRLELAIGMYDIVDGTYLGDFVPPLTGAEPFTFSSPNAAAQGPDGRIYVPDQLDDHIVCFEADGTFVSIFADASDGLDNVRGIDFRDGELFASVSPSAGAFVARFDLAGDRLADFVADTSDPFDVLFLPAGTMMMADIADPDNVRLYDIDASSFTELTAVDFPQQIQRLADGHFLVAAWTEVIEIEADGDIARSLTVDTGRGVYPLENGGWLISSTAGVESFDPSSMELLQAARVGTGFGKIEPAVLPAR